MNQIDPELAAVCQSIAEDGELTEHEVRYLAEWLTANPAACQTVMGSKLANALNQILADGEVNEDELRELAPLLGEAMASQFSPSHLATDEQTEADPVQGDPSPEKVGFVAGVRSWLERRREDRERQRLEKLETERRRIQARQQAVVEAIQRLRKGEGFLTDAGSFVTKPDERICWIEQGVLHEIRVVSRQYVGGSSGVRFRVAKGVSFSVGGRRGQAVSERGLVPVSTGRLIITTKRIAFVGDQKSFAVPLEKLIDVQIAVDGLQFSETSKQNPRLVRFGSPNGDFIVAVMNFVIPG